MYELRIYDFKNEDRRKIYTLLCDAYRIPFPRPSDYALIFEGYTEISPSDFYALPYSKYTFDLFGRDVPLYGVVEISTDMEHSYFFNTGVSFLNSVLTVVDPEEFIRNARANADGRETTILSPPTATPNKR